MIGDGPLRAQAQAMLEQAGLADRRGCRGERDDVPEILRGLDCFVLPSLAEGVSNTILEAMASGLPVIATAVGGNGELIDQGRTGQLVAAADIEAMARKIAAYALDRSVRALPRECGTGRGRAALQPGSDDAALPGSLRSVVGSGSRQGGAAP
jgi:glycosyltransferase involved in cell wall biosynthesis